MVELSTRKREIRGGGNHHKLGLKRISCVSQFTIPDTASTSPDPVGNNTDTRSSKPNEPSRTPGFLAPLISSISLSFSSTTLPSLQEHKVKSSLSISPYHHHELAPSPAYTECSIHRVQRTPKIVCRPFIFSISSWPLNVASASGVPPYRSTATSQFSIRASKVQSPRHIRTVSSELTNE